jgi:hypothetical protein
MAPRRKHSHRRSLMRSAYSTSSRSTLFGYIGGPLPPRMARTGRATSTRLADRRSRRGQYSDIYPTTIMIKDNNDKPTAGQSLGRASVVATKVSLGLHHTDGIAYFLCAAGARLARLPPVRSCGAFTATTRFAPAAGKRATSSTSLYESHLEPCWRFLQQQNVSRLCHNSACGPVSTNTEARSNATTNFMTNDSKRPSFNCTPIRPPATFTTNKKNGTCFCRPTRMSPLCGRLKRLWWSYRKLYTRAYFYDLNTWTTLSRCCLSADELRNAANGTHNDDDDDHGPWSGGSSLDGVPKVGHGHSLLLGR